LVILITANTITLLGLKRMHEKIEHGIQTVLSQKRIEMEQRILKSKNLLLFIQLKMLDDVILRECQLFFINSIFI
jgi:hypothetical protein